MLFKQLKLLWLIKIKHFCNKFGLGLGDVAQKNRKLIKLNKNQFEEWNKIKYNVRL